MFLWRCTPCSQLKASVTFFETEKVREEKRASEMCLVGKFFYLLELLLESPRPAAHVLAACRLWCGRLGGSALGEVGHDGGAGQVGEEGVGVARLPAQRLQGGQTLQAPQVVQVQVHLGNGVRRQKVAAYADGWDLHFRVLLLL